MCGNVLDVEKSILFIRKMEKPLLKKHGVHQDNFIWKLKESMKESETFGSEEGSGEELHNG